MRTVLRHLVVGIALVAGVFVFGAFFPQNRSEAPPELSSGHLSKTFFDEAYEAVDPEKQVFAMSALSAHHLLIPNKIAELFETIESSSVRQVVILSPNHFDAGKHPVQTTDADWQTPYGALRTDDAVIARVRSVTGAAIETQTFRNEHGVSALTPFIKRSFPNAELIPLIIHDSLTEEESKTLGEQIVNLYPHAVVIASADMSHYQSAHVAAYHDEVTMQALQAGGCNGCELEVDANSVLRVLFSVNRARATEEWHQTHHDSSLGMRVGILPEENTSHILGYFQKGKPTTTAFTAIHVVGDIMLDRNVRKKIEETNDFLYPWKQMDRFLMGSHLVVANLEGTVGEGPTMQPHEPPYNFIFDPKSIEAMKSYVDVVSLSNNHLDDRGAAGQTETRAWLDTIGVPWFGGFDSSTPRKDLDLNGVRISLIGYHQFYPNIDSLKKELTEAKSDGRFVIVLPHWGTEYLPRPDVNQESLARIMSEAGADLVLGGHPHVAQGFGQVDATPVAWSLGNFIFDQHMEETWLALTLGVIVKEEAIEIYLLPVFTQDGQPKPLTDGEAKRFFADLANRSAPHLQEQVKTGRLLFPR